jgi:hypothetical protein
MGGDDDEQVLALGREFPGWTIWRNGKMWCARYDMLINHCGSADELAAAVRAAHDRVIPGTVPLAPLRIYAARARQARRQVEAAAAGWQQMKARPRRRRPRRIPPASGNSTGTGA